MSATQDFVALEWIRGELSTTLESAQVALEAVAESPDDTASMRSCLTAIHQVHGTLKMVQLDGPTTMAGEMEQVAQALMNSDVPETQLALETLMQAILQLPVYLDRLHKEQKDSERNYLPMVNNLRVSRGEDKIQGSEPDQSDEDLGPDLSPLTTPPADDVVNAYFQGDGEGNLPKISARYRATLAAILKKKDLKENLTTLGKLFNMLDRLCGESPMGNLAELGLAVIEGIAGGAIKLDKDSATQLRNIDGAIKALADAGQDGLSLPIDEELALGLIALINGAAKETKRIASLREKYAAAVAEPEEVAIGPDDDTMSAVAKIIVEELNSVTDKLDLYVRAQTRNADDLKALLPNLEQIASTLVILGNLDQQATVRHQIDLVNAIESGGDLDDEALLNMAQALLEIEATLGALVQDDEDGGESDSFANLDDAHAAVVKETRSGLALSKEKVIEFIASDWDHSKLEGLIEDLRALRGGLMIVAQNRAGDVLTAAANYVAIELTPDKPSPDLEQMDDLADALTSVDYYLERLLENAGDPYLQMLEVAEAAVEKLGYPVGGDVQAPAAVAEPADDAEVDDVDVLEEAEEIEAPAAEIEEPAAEIEEPAAEIEEVEAEPEAPTAEVEIEEIELDVQVDAEDTVDVEEVEAPAAEVEAPAADVEEPAADVEAPAADVEEPAAEVEIEETSHDAEGEAPAIEEPTPSPVHEVSDVVDEEILEIFVEESEEVLENIAEFLPQWQQNPADNEALTEVRRAFHTLKGSGRMVGATVVGELAWSVENLLNRVMDKTLPATSEIQTLITEVVSRVPEGVEAFKAGNQHAFNADDLAAAADALAEGGSVPAQPEAALEESASEEFELEDLADNVEVPELEEPEIEEIELELEDSVPEEPEVEEIELELEDEAPEEPEVEEIELELEDEALKEPEIEEIELELEDGVPEEPEVEEIELELEDEAPEEPEVEEIELELEDEAPEEPEIEEIELELEDSVPEEPEVEEIELELEDEAPEEPEVEEIELELNDDVSQESVVEEVELELEDEATDEPVVEDIEFDIEDAAVEEIEEPSAVEEISDIEGLSTELEELSAELDDLEPEPEPEIELEEVSLDDSQGEAEEDAFELDTVEELEDAPVEEIVEVVSEADIEGTSLEEEVDAASLAASVVDDDDLELEEIFAMEAEEKLADIEQCIASNEVTSALVAAFHTLKGSSAMADINSISTIAAPMEHLANDYLVQNKPADADLMAFCQQSVALIREVLSDLQNLRNEVPGGDVLIARISDGEEDQAPVSQAAVQFNFEEIALLSEENIATDGWQDIDALVAEMQAAAAQAESLNQLSLSTLLTAMLRIYVESPGKPDDLTLSIMKRAHDHLVFMFDAIASSQRVRPADAVIQELNQIEIAAPLEEETATAPEEDIAEEQSVEAVAEETTTTEPPGEVETQAEPTPAPAATTEAAYVDLPEDQVDEDILPIFLEESEELLEEIDQSIQGWVESGSPDGHLDALLRQLHTLKGGSRMSGLASLGEFTHNFESFLIGLQTHPVDYDDRFFALLHSQQDEIIRRVEIYQNVGAGAATDDDLASMRTGPVPSLDTPAPTAAPLETPAAEVTPETEQPPADEVPAAVEESADPAPARATSGGGDHVVELPDDDVDEDILPIFLEESDDLVEELESSIQTWSESPGDMDVLDVLMRNLHTLKGGARMAGLNSLGEYAHNFETFLIGIQQHTPDLDDEFFALLSKRQDEVIRRVEIYKQLSVGAATEEDLASLKQAIEPSLETEPVENPEAAAEVEPVAAEAPADKPAAKPEKQGEKAASANQEMVRVAADLLEELISMAGESSITRGRVEQQIVDFGDALQEMEETINRIRDQVRRLEIEAESRETLIQSRQAEAEESSFDDLEMDRYTMLQTISRALNEATSDMMDLKDTLGNKSRDAETLLIQQARLSGELQEGLTRTRMVPFARLIPRLRRIVRQISGEVGKAVRFDAYNVEGELDRSVLERIVAPLEHMLRNAVDHGIEDKDKRVEAGKPEQGRISLRLSREGGYFVLTISDDGGGINVEAVRGKAIERGLIVEGQEVSDHEVMQFIMHAGFSTAQKLTQISGRGVGMDVVGSEIKALGGDMTIDSTYGVGTEFTIRIPFTVSINRALMVVVKDETYAVPLNSIEGIVRVSPYELEAYYQPDAPMFEYAGQPYRLAYIGKMLDNTEDPNLSGQIAPLPVILARSGDHAVALQVDRVIGSREVVVKTLGPQFDEVGGISGATVLGDGSVVIILDCMALVRSYEAGFERGTPKVEQEAASEPDNSVLTVMIVDDSVTVRKVTSRLMERQGFEVETAKDGVDAMHQLQELELRPDIVLLDIEMPRMDGFEVLRSVRRDENLKDLPIIMITSRTGEKHKQQAMELGVNQYLGKPFQEANLLATIDEVIENARKKS